MEFYRVLDSLPSRWRSFFVTLTVRAIRVKSPTGSRTIYVAEEFWHWVMASVPVPFTPSHVRDQWDAAVERSGLKGVSLSDLRRLRSKLLAEAKDRPGRHIPIRFSRNELTQSCARVRRAQGPVRRCDATARSDQVGYSSLRHDRGSESSAPFGVRSCRNE